jgi:hypothetical protein
LAGDGRQGLMKPIAPLLRCNIARRLPDWDEAV